MRLLAAIRTAAVLLRLEFKDLIPVVLHAYDDPALPIRLIVKRLREGTDPGVGQPQGRSVRILATGIVVKHQYREPHAVASFGIFQHLLVAGRVANGRKRPSSDHQVDTLGFAGVVVVQKQLWFLGEKRCAVFLVAIFSPAAVPTTCSGGIP
jgi:hypothetical protein